MTRWESHFSRRCRLNEIAMATKWHYTKGLFLEALLRTGEILPATAGVPRGERPIVWFSTDSRWEPSVGMGYFSSDGEYHEDWAKYVKMVRGLGRIGVAPETAPYDWSALKELSGMSSEMAQALERTAIESGARPLN
jgi:hypothetical protein